MSLSPDVINEIVWHFAGYFRLADDVARDRLEYLEGTHRQQFEDYTIPLPQTPFQADLNPFDTQPIPPPSITVFDNAYPAAHVGLRSADSDPEPEPEAILSPPAPRFTSFGGGGGGGGGGQEGRHINVTYDEDGSQQQVLIHQVNSMQDNDRLLVGEHTGVTELNHAQTGEFAHEMWEAAGTPTPAELALPRGVMEVARFLDARDAERLESGSPPSEHAVAPGIYVNGELQDPGYRPTLPELAPPPEEAPHPVDTRGEIASLGSNTAANIALVVDLNEGSPTMIVLGDYFSTEAIVQTWSYADHDEVTVGGGSPLSEVLTGNNTAENIANFDHQASIYPDLDGYFSGWDWNVHVIEGDFYDINLLIQEIYLRDNDVTVQETQHSIYEVHTGDNQQFNVAELFSGGLDYDLIIIGGDYHGGNYIFQHVFLIDDDVAMMSASDGQPVQAIGTGGNTLMNYGAIHTYGNETLIPLTAEARSLTTELANRATTLDPMQHGFVAPAVGTGPLNVLYITGDYYDVNAIWQYINIADADTALQLLSADEAFRHVENGQLVQSMDTGGNTLFNEAAIVDVGTGSTQVGGEIYTETILVQGEFVGNDDDTVVHDNTDALVNELIAFIGEDEEEVVCAPATAPSHPEDMLGGVIA